MLLVNEAEETADLLRRWREELLAGILRVGVVIGGLALAASVADALISGRPIILAIVFGIFYLVVLAITFVPQIGFAIRASIVVAILVFIAISDVANFGLVRTGAAYFFAAIVLAGLLLGMRWSWLVFAIMIATVLGASLFFIGRGEPPALDLNQLVLTPSAWLNDGITFALLGTAIIVSTSFLLRRLRRSLRELRHERRFVDQILDTAEAFIVVIDGEGKIVRANTPIGRLVGRPTEAIIGASAWSLFRSEHLATEAQEIFIGLEPGNPPRHYDATWIDSQEAKRTITWTIVALPGAERFYIATGIDITARVVAEAEREALQREMLAAQSRMLADQATPIIPVAEGVLVMPLVGTLSADRLMAATEMMLNAVAAQRARAVIVDITGVPFIDTAVAAALVEQATAARLLGAQVTLSGVSPEVAQTIVGLGLDRDLGSLAVAATLQAAISEVLHLQQR